LIAGPLPRLVDGAVALREVRREDAGDLYRWRMHPLSRFSFHDTDEVPYERHERFLEAYFAPTNRDAWFVIEVDGRPVGTISLYDPSPDGREAEWGRFVVAPEERGRGWGRRALSLLLEYARSARIRGLRCDVLASNEAPRALYRDLGFVETGVVTVRGRDFVTMRLELQPA
jgi:RimJ/RimL family protein N-acetyltransferase